MKEIDYKRYFQIMSALMAGRKVSKEDRNYFADTYAEADPAVYETIKARLDRGDALTDADFNMMFEEARKLALTPENKAKVLEMAQKAEQGKVAQNVRTGLNLLLAGTDIATSIQQIKKADQLSKGVRKPARPRALERDVLLQQALNESADVDRGVERALLPAREANREQYQNDLAAGRTASAGQASSYGTYAQGASLRRERADLNLVPIGENVRQQNVNRRDRLIGQHVAEGQAINASQGRYYGEDLYQYGLDRNLAAELGQIGRSNLRSSMRGFAAPLPDAIGRYGTQRKYDNIYNRMSAYNTPEVDAGKIASEAFRTNDINWGELNNMTDLYRQYEDTNFFD